MKKNIFKKIVASLATVAMAAGLFTAMPAEETKAADVSGDGKVYFVGSETTWTPGEAGEYEMESEDGKTFTYTLNITEPKRVQFKLLAGAKSWDAQWNAKDKKPATQTENIAGGDNFEVECGKVGTLTITAVFENEVLKSLSAEGNAIYPLALPDEYYVVGEAKLCGTAWDDNDFAGAKQLTETSTGVWTYKFENLAAETYYYNVIQLKSWDNKLKDSSFVLAVKSDVTFKYTKSTGEVEVVIEPLEELPPVDGEGSEGTGSEGTGSEGTGSTGTGSEGTGSTGTGSTGTGSTGTGSTGTGSTGTGSTGTGSTGTGSTGTGSTGTGSTGTTTDKTPSTGTDNKTEEKKGVTVEVTLSADTKWDKVFLHAWGEDFGTTWPGVEMTKKDGKWYATLDTTLTKLSFVVSNGNGEQTVDIENVEGKEVKITLGAKNAEGKFEGTATGSTGSTGAAGTQKPGDVAPVAIMLVVAAVAAAMVVASKKKVICE